MILTGVDNNHEDILPWWLNNAIKHNPNENIGVWDFGMSSAMRDRIQKEYSDVWLSIPLQKRSDSGWFYKLHAVIDAPEKRVAWLDVDCEILTNIEDVFNLVPDDMVGLTRDWVRGNWWATGVIVINDRPDLLYKWNDRLLSGNIRGDQEALEALIGKGTHPQIQELPQDYQWLRLSIANGKDSPTKKVVHWTGPEGKKIIRESMK
tara:strand:+ start:324 stop:941 length:618 start_codon:yes stop_codon:yes gene_type:complete